MNARDWSRVIAKEVRAIGPVWAACALAMLGWKAPQGEFQSLLQAIAMTAYLVGTSAIGALSFGHEFNYGTWSFLLTQPVARRRLLLTKFGVLVALLVLLGVMATWLDLAARSNDFGVKVLWMPVFLGAFVAPWLTLVIRRPIGAAVFAASTPIMSFLAGQLVAVNVYGYDRAADKVTTAFVAVGVSAACIAGAFLGWRRFLRLEVTDGTGSGGHHAHRTAAIAQAPGVTRTAPLWRLLGKELRLQQLTLAIAAFYAVAYVVSVVTIGNRPGYSITMGALTVLYGSLLSMVAGAVASAEERQLGTLDSQLLLPVAVRWQWMVKAATVLVVAIVLGYALPRVLFSIVPPPIGRMRDLSGDVVQPTFAVIAVLMAAVSLYVSSVCRSTLAAVILGFPVYATVAVLFREMADPVTRASHRWVHAGSPHNGRFGGPFEPTMIVIAAVLLAALVVRLALTNHRYADRSIARIAAHAALFVVALAAGLALLGAVGIN